ncbi:MAG: luciferase family protein [Pseudomonadota bacterium]
MNTSTLLAPYDHARDVPPRRGQRPRTTSTNPHAQIDQQPETPLTEDLRARLETLDGVSVGPSRRAPPGTHGFFLEGGRGPETAFLLGTEFAHIHPGPDHSLHMTLPEPVRTGAIEAGWAEPHPLAGQPTISEHIVLIYAPRDPAELEVVARLGATARQYARGS